MNSKPKAIALLVGAIIVLLAGVYVGFHLHKPGQAHYSLYFTPKDDGTGAFLSFLDKTQKGAKVLVMDFTYNNERVNDRFVDLHDNHKADVHVLLDLKESRTPSTNEAPLIQKLQDHQIEAVVGTSPQKGAIMHMKAAVIINPDGSRWTYCGSWNMTGDADNQANFLLITDDPAFADKFSADWEYLHTFMLAQQQRREAKQQRAHN